MKRTKFVRNLEIEISQTILGEVSVFKKIFIMSPDKKELIKVRELEITTPSNYEEIFLPLASDLETISFPEKEIVGIIKTLSLKSNNHAYLFLIRIGGEYMVLNVKLYSVIGETLNAYIWPLKNDNNVEGSGHVWTKEENPHIFIPAQEHHCVLC